MDPETQPFLNKKKGFRASCPFSASCWKSPPDASSWCAVEAVDFLSSPNKFRTQNRQHFAAEKNERLFDQKHC